MCASKRVAMRDYSSRLAATLFWGDACCEDFLIAFFAFCFYIAERSKEFWGDRCVVVEPLSFFLVEERAVMAVRAESKWLARDFDSTKGFPGEDVRLL